MTLASARAMRPDLDLRQVDPEPKRMLANIADWLRRFTPLAAADGPDGAVLDIQGCAHLFGGEAALVATIETELGAQGFHARCAAAPNPALAWGASRSSVRTLAQEQRPSRRGESLANSPPVAALRVPRGDDRRTSKRGAYGRSTAIS